MTTQFSAVSRGRYCCHRSQRVLRYKSFVLAKIYLQERNTTYFCPIRRSSLSNPPILLERSRSMINTSPSNFTKSTSVGIWTSSSVLARSCIEEKECALVAA